MVSRLLQTTLQSRMADKKAIILMGPRQVGKTTLLSALFKNKKDILWLSGDETDIRQQFEKPTSARLRNIIGKHKIVVIDEAQRIENIGICLKLITDHLKDVKVFATGSSAFELANKTNEPLTGRKWEYTLYPLSFQEMVKENGLLTEKRMLEHRLIYGSYPDVINNPGMEQDILKQLSDSYLYKDILTWERIQKPDRMERLAQAIAFQVGNEVSYHELGQMAGLNTETVEHYINLMEKTYILFRLGTFSRNLRNELKKSRKIYFYDNGIRNALIKQFNPLSLRNDVGALWENYLMSERIKFCEYNRLYSNRYFWRNHAQNEIDLIEERGGKLHAFEFKWSTGKKADNHKFPKVFVETYAPAETTLITPQNYTEFIFKD